MFGSWSKCENGTGLIETFPAIIFLKTASVSGFLTSPGISFPTRVIDRLIKIEMQPRRIKSRGIFLIATAVRKNEKG
jgi:hypothetical protein